MAEGVGQNNPEVISGLKKRQLLKLGMLTAGVGAFLALPKEANALGYATTPNVINVKDKGAVGDGTTDDSNAIQAAVTSAIATGGLATVYFPPGNYRITKSISVNYKTKGRIVRQGIKFKGDHAALFLNGVIDVWAFRIELDEFTTHDSFFSFEGFWFYTNNDGPTRMNAVFSNFACGLTIQNCVFERVWRGLELNRGTNVRVNACDFIGCFVGAELYRCRDSLISNSYSHAAGQVGFYVHGIHDFGTDGGAKIDQCIAIEGGTGGVGIRFQGVYTPFLTNIIVEHNHINLLVESCQYGFLDNMYSGPSDIGIRFGVGDASSGSTLANIGWNIRSVSFQSEVQLEKLQLCKVEGLVSRACNSSSTNAVVYIKDSFEVEFNAMLREIGSAVPIGLRIANDCWGIKVNGGFYEKKIKFDSGRPGNNLLNSPHVYQDVEFEGSVMDGETGIYFLKDGQNQGVEKHVANNRVLPSSVFNQTINANQSVDFSPAGVVKDPGDFFISIARFAVVGGNFGSFSGAEISVIRTKQRIQCALVNDIGKIGSFFVQLATVASTDDTIRLVNGAGSMQISARITLLEYHVVTA